MLENTGQKTNTDNAKTKHNTQTRKANNAKQNYPSSVASYDTRPGNKVGLFYDAPEHTRVNQHIRTWSCNCSKS